VTLEIYVALNDQPEGGSGRSFVVGAFSTDQKARDACQADASVPLVWADAEAPHTDGSSYAVVLVDLDEPV
jgi:hypothetical protein